MRKALMEIKGNPVVRFLVFPLAVLEKKRKREDYLKTGEPEKIRNYKNIHENERCFIVGNGPSLNFQDLDMLHDEVTFAANRIYMLYNEIKWRPTYYVCIDKELIRREIANIDQINVKGKFIDWYAAKYTLSKDYIFICANPFFVLSPYGYKKSYIKEDISTYFINGFSVSFTMIQLAIYMGFKEIYLLGMDFSMPYYKDKFGIPHKTEETKEHFEGGSAFRRTYFNRDSNLYAFQQAKKYCDEHNIFIKNVTRGGKLEVFERDTLENVLEKG